MIFIIMKNYYNLPVRTWSWSWDHERSASWPHDHVFWADQVAYKSGAREKVRFASKNSVEISKQARARRIIIQFFKNDRNFIEKRENSPEMALFCEKCEKSIFRKENGHFWVQNWKNRVSSSGEFFDFDEFRKNSRNSSKMRIFQTKST